MIEDYKDGTTFEQCTIDSSGNATFTEYYDTSMDYPYDYTMTVTHAGVFTYDTNRRFTYTGTGAGVAQEDPLATCIFNVSAEGTGSEDHNQLAGYWSDTEQYYYNGSLMGSDVDASQVVMTRVSYIPPEESPEIVGTYLITIYGENFSWSGEVTMNPDGTMTGYISKVGDDAPLAGLYEYDDASNTLTFEYTSSMDLPIVGERVFVFEATGTSNDANTVVTGTWSITLTAREFNGTFTMVKSGKQIPNTRASGWILYD
ncbi:hypothetical protein JXA32_03470 [Candidatus Sumerlaeota bacterium]|nr:hypothetical protein [Candidatus Sumerlaeota bacterium]